MPVHFAALNQPVANTFRKDGESQYILSLVPNDEQIEKWERDVRIAVGDPTFRTSRPKYGISIRESDGRVFIRATTKFQPEVYDANGNKMATIPNIGKGSVVRMMVSLTTYDKGVSLTLHSIQVKKLVEWEGSGSFGSVE